MRRILCKGSWSMTAATKVRAELVLISVILARIRRGTHIMGRISFLMLGFLTLFMPPLTSAAQNSSCTLEANLYENRKPPAGGHAAEGKDTKAIDKEYMDFFRALAESSLSENKGSFDLCAELAKNDPIAARVVTFVRYLREGRRNSDEFISSFPTTEAQLTDFWSLDVIAMHSVGHGPASLPGIPLPDGIVDKLLSELFALVLQDNPAATKKYFFI